MDLFTSDLHFGHVNILKYCPQRVAYLGVEQDDVAGMNEALVDLWNSQVTADDTVFVVGDIAMGKVAETLQYVARLNGHIVLIMGNHDRMHPIMFKSKEKTNEWVDAYHAAGIETIAKSWVYDFNGIEALVHHFPYEADHTEDPRYLDYRPENTGTPLVHGHVHDIYRTSGPQYNVGIDAHEGRFQTVQEIGDYFRSIGFGVAR